MRKIDSNVVQKWSKALDGIKTDYMAEVTAQLLENQAKAVLTEASKLTEEQLTLGATTVAVPPRCLMQSRLGRSPATFLVRLPAAGGFPRTHDLQGN